MEQCMCTIPVIKITFLVAAEGNGAGVFYRIIDFLIFPSMWALMRDSYFCLELGHIGHNGAQ